jgi:hypothetical protein
METDYFLNGITLGITGILGINTSSLFVQPVHTAAFDS